MSFLSKFGFDLGKIHHRLPWVPKRSPEIVFVVPFIVEGWREGFQVQRFEGDILPELGQQVCSTMGTNTSNQLNHWVIDSFSHCFLVFLFRSFVTQSPISCISWLIRSFIRWFIHPLIHSFIHSFMPAFIHSFIDFICFHVISCLKNYMLHLRTSIACFMLPLFWSPGTLTHRDPHLAPFALCARRDTSSNSGSTSREPWSEPRCPSPSSCQSSWSSSDSPPNCSPHNLSKRGIFKEKTPTKTWRWTR